MEIGQKLKDARAKAGLTQEQVAEKILVTRQTISNWENGKSLPDIVSVLNLSDLFQISLDELLKGDAKMKEKMEKDAKTARGHRRFLLTAAILVFAVAAAYAASALVGGGLYEFCEAAIPWVVLDLGVALAAAYEKEKA